MASANPSASARSLEADLRQTIEDPTVKASIMRVLIALRDLGGALLKYFETVNLNPAVKNFVAKHNPRFNIGDMLIGYVMLHYGAPRGAEYARYIITKLMISLTVAIDPPTQGYAAGEIIKRMRMDLEEVSRPASTVGTEALTLTNAIKATGTSHESYLVRLFKKDIDASSYSYVGLGIRVSELSMWLPHHVATYLDGEFKAIGNNRHVVVTKWDPALIRLSDEFEDTVIYEAGKPFFSKVGAKIAKLGKLDKTRRVFLRTCVGSSEHGAVSEGRAVDSSFNYKMRADYSSVEGNSGGAVCQLQDGGEVVVGQHLGFDKKPSFGDHINFFLLPAVFKVRPVSISPENSNSSVSSGSHAHSRDSDQDHRDRARFARESEEYRAKVKREGDHRFDDGALEREWEEVDATIATDEFRRNRNEALDEFTYVKSRGWLRRGGKGKGGVKIHTESVKTPPTPAPVYELSDPPLEHHVNLSRGESELLKGSERQPEPLIEIPESSLRTSSTTVTSQDSRDSRIQQSLPSTSVSSERQTESLQEEETNEIARILLNLEESVQRGRISKSQLQKRIAAMRPSEQRS